MIFPEYHENEHIKLFRKFLNWEWYQDINTKTVFLHCLLKANWKPGSWKGHKYERGQFFTSINNFSKEIRLTVRQTRTAFEHLQSTGELTIKGTSKFSVITVNNYDQYQTSDKQNGTQTTSEQQAERQTEGQTTDKRPTNDRQQLKNIKNIKNNKPPYNPPFDEKASNLENFNGLLEAGELPVSEYLGENVKLTDKLRDWFDYKDHLSPKSKNHYATQKGLSTFVAIAVQHAKEYRTESVCNEIDHAISSNWMGVVWERISEKNKMIPFGRAAPDYVPQPVSDREREIWGQ